MNTKKEETRRFLLFSLILHRYDLREVDGVSCRVFDGPVKIYAQIYLQAPAE